MQLPPHIRNMLAAPPSTTSFIKKSGTTALSQFFRIRTNLIEGLQFGGIRGITIGFILGICFEDTATNIHQLPTVLCILGPFTILPGLNHDNTLRDDLNDVIFIMSSSASIGLTTTISYSIVQNHADFFSKLNIFSGISATIIPGLLISSYCWLR